MFSHFLAPPAYAAANASPNSDVTGGQRLAPNLGNFRLTQLPGNLWKQQCIEKGALTVKAPSSNSSMTQLELNLQS
jgi:hypothetical protein